MKTKGIYFLYRLLQAFGLPVLLFYFLFRGLRNRAYWKHLAERFGFLPHSLKQTSPGAIWLHAVSVGEVLASVELLSRLRAAFPRNALFVSVGTIAGRATAGQRLRGIADGIFYLPADYVFAVRRVLRALQPSVVVIAETEIWPNLFREVKRTGAALTLVNGRISDRAFPRYRRLRWFFHAVLPAADSLLVQSDLIAQRFLTLGAPPDRLHVTGNFKYDFEAREAPPDSPVCQHLARLRPTQVWIAASTMPPAGPDDVDEDDLVIAAFQELRPGHPGLLLLLVPRKPERFDVVARKLEAAAIPYVRRTSLPSASAAPVLLLDTIGELGGLCPLADVVFMGGSVARRGGHNILEPAFFAKPVIVGPHMENFRDIAEQFRSAQAFIEIAGPPDLARAVAELLDDPSRARQIGGRAVACAEARRGATARALDEIRELFRTHLPRYRPAMPWFQIRWLLARLWERGARRRQAQHLRAQQRIDTPVISVGNLSMGGTGKTPCVLRLVETLKARGHRPGILTRGYGRGSPEKHLVLPPGAAVKAQHSGDEPQLFVRSRLAPVGIGIDRVAAGRLLRNAFDIDLILLDDGFQHLRLARNVDVLLVDALDPFGGGDVFPLGRLREPITGLARADIIVITRANLTGNAPAIEEAVRRFNPRAPVFRAWVEPLLWVEYTSGKEYPLAPLPFERAAAFCGLGNPQSFRRTLTALGLDLADWVEFADHHRYRPQELERTAHNARAQGATALVTSEKDSVNLCDACEDLVAPLGLFWLKVRMHIDREDELLDEIERRLR